MLCAGFAPEAPMCRPKNGHRRLIREIISFKGTHGSLMIPPFLILPFLILPFLILPFLILPFLILPFLIKKIFY